MKLIALGFCLLLLAACTSTHSQQATPSTTSTTSAKPTAATSTSPGALGQPGCRPPLPSNGSEVQGTSNRIQMWGLIMVAGPPDPLRVNQEVKIVWRITGSGELHLTAIDPHGRTHPLRWGPESHLSSNYGRPGDEWGAGYLFTLPGCWTLRATRGPAAANVWLQISA